MNWCQDHWDYLRNAVEEHGLGEFVEKDPDRAATNMQRFIDGDDEEFDPLMGSWMRINAKMAESPALNGRIMDCPLCILVADGQPELVERWVNGCLDDATRFALEQGLIRKS